MRSIITKQLSEFAVIELKEALGSKAIDAAGNLSFTALIKYYHHNEQMDSENLSVHVPLLGYDALTVDIDEGNKIRCDTHHTNFRCSDGNQIYSFDGLNKIFTITGTSTKMGEYKVEIHFV